jgi:hypothetical protein
LAKDGWKDDRKRETKQSRQEADEGKDGVEKTRTDFEVVVVVACERG